MWQTTPRASTMLTPGIGEILNLYFTTAYDTVGTYKFTFELRVPPDSWLPIPRSNQKGVAP